MRTTICFLFYPVLTERQVVKRQQGIWGRKGEPAKDVCAFGHSPLSTTESSPTASAAHIPGNRAWLLRLMTGLCAENKQRVPAAK